MLKHRNELSFGHPDGHSVLKQNCIMPMNEAYQDMTQYTAHISRDVHKVQALYCIAQCSKHSSKFSLIQIASARLVLDLLLIAVWTLRK